MPKRNMAVGLPINTQHVVMAGSSSSESSPTDSEFSIADTYAAAKDWTEDAVCAFLDSIGFGHLQDTFRDNHITGEQFLDLDKDVMRDFGIPKLGDRIRLYVVIKRLRNKVVNHEDRPMQRVSCQMSTSLLLWTIC